tara:strand:- start:232 stop:1476 length:1245 start_codon:yes stop_codon:yes gene_type:complete
MSDDTAAHFGAWSQEFSAWAQTQDVGRVVIITPEDLLNGRDPTGMSDEARAALLKSFIKRNFPDFDADKFDDEYLSLGRNAVLGQGRAQSLDVDGDGKNDLAIVIAASRDQTKEQAAAKSAHLTPDNIKNLRGTDLDWQAMTIAHEIGHLSQPNKSRDKNLVWEIEAEQDMVQFMTTAHKKGLISDLRAVDDLTLIRNIGSFYFKDDLQTHVVGPGVQTPSEGPVPVAEHDHVFQEPLHQAQMDVSRAIGVDLINDTHRIKVLEKMLGERGLYSFDAYKLPPMEIEDKRAIVDILRGKVSIEDGVAVLPADVQDKIAETFENETEILGIGALMDDPALMYDMTRRLYLSGDFDDNPIGKQYAYEFLTAAQAHAPENFSVFNQDEKFIPPIFKQTDSFTPTDHLDNSQNLTTMKP